MDDGRERETVELMELIVICGLPGSGKSELAENLSREMEIPCFSRDRIEAAIVTSNLEFPSKGSRRPNLHGVGYDVVTSLVTDQLRLKQSAIVDSVCPKASLRRAWRNLAEKYGANWCPIECICSDADIHRRRIKNRQRAIAGWYEVDWPDVQRLAKIFEPWDEDHLILDAINPAAINVDSAICFLKDLSPR